MSFYDVTNPPNYSVIRTNTVQSSTQDYAGPALAGSTRVVARGNPGSSSSLLLSDFNTIHYYSATGTSSVDISTRMVDNAVYQVTFSTYGGSTGNNDFKLSPNFTAYPANTFYNVYQNVTSTGTLSYGFNNNTTAFVDIVSGSFGWDPVGTLTIYNIKNAKKIKFAMGDTTGTAQGQTYWTDGSVAYNTGRLTAIPYDISTTWSNVGTITFTIPTFSNWNIWVQRIL
jgi:hypothetical protein